MWVSRHVRVRRSTLAASSQTERAAHISHDLRLPLASIRCAAENIRDGVVNNDDGVREQATLIVEQATQAADLLDQFLNYVAVKRESAGHGWRTLTVSEIIDDAVHSVSSLIQEGRFVLEREVQPGLPAVIGDLKMLSHCIQNLLTNAMKYSGQSRWVGISTGIGKNKRFGREEIQIDISDHGLGISRADLVHIFEPFYRCQDSAVLGIRGNGLGLWIAKCNAEACGGSLSVVSKIGAGSVFTLHLPLRR